MKPRKPVLTIDFFVSQVQPGLLQTRNLSLLLDTSSGQLEEPPDTDVKYDTSHKHANCQDDCKAAPVGGICNCGYYGHFCFADNDDSLPCVAVVDARNDCLLWLTSKVTAGKAKLPSLSAPWEISTSTIQHGHTTVQGFDACYGSPN